METIADVVGDFPPTLIGLALEKALDDLDTELEKDTVAHLTTVKSGPTAIGMVSLAAASIIKASSVIKSS